MLAINEEFYSIQGEGLHTGVPMYFVRLQGCDVGCYFCDTKYTWRDKNPDVREEDIVKRAVDNNVEWICITGGEPYEQDLTDLLNKAWDNNLKTHIETSGSKWIDYGAQPDWVCLSPKDLFTKEGFQTKAEFKKRSDEIKCVVTKETDIQYYAKNYYRYCDEDKPLIFQPVDNDIKLAGLITEYIQKEVLYNARCMIQCHKLLNLR